MVSNVPEALLEVRQLSVYFPRRGPNWWSAGAEPHRAVDGISFSIAAGATMGLVGESGCGKSTTARAILRLVPIHAGEVWWRGARIDRLTESGMRPLRGEMQMIFQDPYASLNPRMTIGNIVAEPLRIFHGELTRRDRILETMRLLDIVGLNPRHINRYPHEFSGGQRQRIGIARALAVRPKLIVCDEPVSALDVSIQAQIINLLRDLQQRFGLTYLFISHDLAVVRQMAGQVAVMHEGKIVESGEVAALYARPQHAYTRRLLAAHFDVP